MMTCTSCHSEALNVGESLTCPSCGAVLPGIIKGSYFPSDRYRVGEYLFRDSYCHVFSLEDVQGHRTLAIREFFPFPSCDAATTARYLEASKHLKKVERAPLVPLAFVFNRGARFYAVEEIPEGLCLHDLYINEGPWPIPKVRQVFENLLAAFASMQAMEPPIFHGSLFSRGVFVGDKSTPVLLAGCAYLPVAATGKEQFGNWLEEDLQAAARIALQLANRLPIPEHVAASALLKCLAPIAERDARLAAVLERLLSTPPGAAAFAGLRGVDRIQEVKAKLAGRPYKKPPPLEPSDSSEPLTEPSAPTDPEPFRQESIPQPRRRSIIGPLMGAVMLGSLAFLAWWSWAPSTRDFEENLRRGHWAQAFRLYRDAAADSKRQSMSEIARPYLEKASAEWFQRWWNEEDLGNATWLEALEALELLARIRNKGHNQSRQVFAMAQVLLEERHPQEALEKYREALRHEPSWDLALDGIAQACQTLGDLHRDCALNNYRSALAAGPTRVPTHLHLASLYLGLGRYDEAEQLFRKAVELEPDRPRSHYILGQFYDQRGAAWQAQMCQEYQKASELARGRPRPLFDVAWTHRRILKLCP